MSPQTTPILEARELMLASGVRSDSLMFRLPVSTFETLASLIFCERVAPKAALALVEKEGIPRSKLPGLTAFYQWQRDFLPFYSACSRRAAVRVANEVAEEAKKTPGEWNAAIADKLSQATFELLSDPNRDPETVKNFVTGCLNFSKLDVDREKVAQAERKLKLLEDSAALAKAELTKVAARGGLTPETQAQIQTALSLL